MVCHMHIKINIVVGIILLKSCPCIFYRQNNKKVNSNDNVIFVLILQGEINVFGKSAKNIIMVY